MYNKKKNNTDILIIILTIIIVCILVYIVFFNNNGNNSKEDDVIVFNLIDSDITINYNESYSEPGYTCHINNNDITNSVEIINPITENKPGYYRIFYKCKNEVLVRNVTILEPSSYELIINYSFDKQKNGL